jgi:hypothetical protein
MLEAKLDESPELLNYIQGATPTRPVSTRFESMEPKTSSGSDNSREVEELRAEVAALKSKVQKLEDENLLLQNKLLAKPAAAAAPVSATVAPVGQQGNVEEWKSRAEQLEKENFELRKSLLVKRKVESGHSTSRTNLFATVEENDDEKNAALTPRTADPRELIRRRLSRNYDAPDHPSSTTEDEHPDWVKKYSDQHKRAYWRNKVCPPYALLIRSLPLRSTGHGQDKLDSSSCRGSRPSCCSSERPSHPHPSPPWSWQRGRRGERGGGAQAC